MRGLASDTRLPLLALADVVHFPCTDLGLHVFEPRHRRLVRDLLEVEEWSRAVGVVLLKPGSGCDGAGRPEVFPGGTAATLVDAEFLPDGRCDVILHGEFRFELEREYGDGPYRQAVVRPLPEPLLNEQDAGIVAVRRNVIELAGELAAELGERFELTEDELAEIADNCIFEEMVNRIAAGLELPPLRKLELLREPLPERALSLATILGSRRQVLSLLRPYRHLAGNSESN